MCVHRGRALAFAVQTGVTARSLNGRICAKIRGGLSSAISINWVVTGCSGAVEGGDYIGNEVALGTQSKM